METNSKRLIDVSTIELQELIERSVQRVLDMRQPKPDPKYYTVQDVAKLLRCHKLTIYRLKDSGKLNYRRVNGGKIIRFTQEDIDSFLLNNPGFTDKYSIAKK